MYWIMFCWSMHHIIMGFYFTKAYNNGCFLVQNLAYALFEVIGEEILMTNKQDQLTTLKFSKD